MTGKLHSQIVGPGQGCYKLNTTQIRFSFKGIITGKLHPQMVGSGAGSSQTEHTQIRFSFTVFMTGKRSPPGGGPGQGPSQTEHNKYCTVQFTGFIIGKLHPTIVGPGQGRHKLNTQIQFAPRYGIGTGVGLSQTENNKYSSAFTLLMTWKTQQSKDICNTFDAERNPYSWELLDPHPDWDQTRNMDTDSGVKMPLQF
jgi:hypothetical protein